MISLLFHDSAPGGPLRVDRAPHDHLVAAPRASPRMPRDVMDSLGTAEAVVTVSVRVVPRAAACAGVPRNRQVSGAGWAVRSGSRRRGLLCSLTVTAARSAVPRRDDFLADRHDAIYRDEPQSRTREVA